MEYRVGGWHLGRRSLGTTHARTTNGTKRIDSPRWKIVLLKIARHNVSAFGEHNYLPPHTPHPKTKCHDDRSFAGVAASSSENSQPPASPLPASQTQTGPLRQGTRGLQGCRAGLGEHTDMSRFSFLFSYSGLLCAFVLDSLSITLSSTIESSLTGPVASI